MIQNSEHDMRIVDQEMPMMTGLELLETVRNNEKIDQMSILIFTSWLTDNLTTDFEAAGADACITKKEFQKEDFIGMIGGDYRWGKRMA